MSLNSNTNAKTQDREYLLLVSKNSKGFTINVVPSKSTLKKDTMSEGTSPTLPSSWSKKVSHEIVVPESSSILVTLQQNSGKFELDVSIIPTLAVHTCGNLQRAYNAPKTGATKGKLLSTTTHDEGTFKDSTATFDLSSTRCSIASSSSTRATAPVNKRVTRQPSSDKAKANFLPSTSTPLEMESDIPVKLTLSAFFRTWVIFLCLLYLLLDLFWYFLVIAIAHDWPDIDSY